MENEDLNKLWAEVKDVWEHGFMGVDVGSIAVALAIFFGFLLIRGILSKYILRRLHLWAEKSENKVDDKVVDAIMPPIRFIPIVLGLFFAGQYLELDETLGDFFGRMTRSLIVFTMFWGLHRALEPIGQMSKKLEDILSPTMMNWIFKVTKVVVVFIGAAVILEVWGIAVGPLLAGLGLFGAAVALGAQDLFKNLIGGITIIAEKRFSPGDWILVDGVVEGTVEDIGFRSTHVRRFDKAPVHVPNSALSDVAVTNFSRMTHRRIKWKIGVEYRTSVDQLKIIRDEIMKELETNDAFAKKEEVSTFVRVDAFNDSSIDFLIYCFTNTTNWGEWLEIKESFAMRIKEIVEDKAGTGFAFPSQSVYLESLPDDAAEIFVPPVKKAS
ncbi:MAG: mechanosensitive ion channel protein [Micavibrio sp.]|nr:MAG: mechanosensitive ion channel protein [Micavibrio sp.]